MLHCKPETIVTVLEKAKEVDLLGPYQTFFITSLVIIYFLYLHLHTEKAEYQRNIDY